MSFLSLNSNDIYKFNEMSIKDYILFDLCSLLMFQKLNYYEIKNLQNAIKLSSINYSSNFSKRFQ
jgi:hypothetical protein